MKKIHFGLLAAALFLPGFPSFAQAPRQPERVPDGGTREVLISILIPTLPNSPFTATVNTEWIRQLADGTAITLKNHRLIARDAVGRVFQERRSLVPDDGKLESVVTQIEISDPVSHEQYICAPYAQVCQLEVFIAPSLVRPPPAAGTAPMQPLAPGQEFLGKQTIEGLETVGTRETQVIETGAIGNDGPLLVKREFWYSSKLGVNLISIRQDPRFGTQKFRVDGVTLGDPEAKLFEAPSGFKIIDLRKPPEFSSPPAPPQN